MSILIVVAHPDDEALGAGGLATQLNEAGIAVTACILCGSAGARRGRPEVERLHRDTARASEILGMAEPILGDFPNIELNTVPHLSLVRFVEDAIERTGATSLVTHHPSDLNDDHGHTARACLAASRLFQRKGGIAPLDSIYLMEVPSSTDWAFPENGAAFSPDVYLALSEAQLERKLAALAAYEGVMRPAPHSRSTEVITSLARCRGAQAGTMFAEAFQTVFRCASGRSLVGGRD